MEERKIKKSNEFGNIISYETCQNMINQMEKHIYKVKKKESSEKYSTGFLCKIPYPNLNKMIPVLITSNNVITKGILENNEQTSIEIISRNNIIKIMNLNERKKYTNKLYNIVIIELKAEDKVQNLLELDENIINNIINNKNDNNIYINQSIYSIQYKNNNLSLSLGKLNKINERKKYYFNHSINNKEISLGSPIFNLNNKVLGLHIKDDIGTFLNYPLKKFILENIYNNSINKEIIETDNIKNKILFDELQKNKEVSNTDNFKTLSDICNSFYDDLQKNDYFGHKINWRTSSSIEPIKITIAAEEKLPGICDFIEPSNDNFYKKVLVALGTLILEVDNLLPNVGTTQYEILYGLSVYGEEIYIDNDKEENKNNIIFKFKLLYFKIFL